MISNFKKSELRNATWIQMFMEYLFPTVELFMVNYDGIKWFLEFFFPNWLFKIFYFALLQQLKHQKFRPNKVLRQYAKLDEK